MKFDLPKGVSRIKSFSCLSDRTDFLWIVHSERFGDVYVVNRSRNNFVCVTSEKLAKRRKQIYREEK